MSFGSVAASKAPKVWLRLEDVTMGDTDTATDSSGTGNHGQYVGAVTPAAGLLVDGGQAASVAGAGRIRVPNHASWIGTDRASLFIRAKTTTLSGTHQVVSSRNGIGTSGSGFTIRQDGANLVFYPFSGFSGNTITFGTLVADQTYSIGLSYNPTLGRYEAYLDGVLVGTKVTTYRVPAYDLVAGSSQGGFGESFSGTVDELLFTDAYWSATDQAELHEAATVAEKPIVASGDSDASVIAAVLTVTFPTTIAGSGESTATVDAIELTAGVRNNRVGGRRRAGIGEVVWEPPVVVPDSVTGQARVVAHAFSTPTIEGTVPTYDTQTIQASAHRDRLLIGGKDVSYFRGVPTPFSGFGLVEPLMYGPTSITFPQIAAAFERPGVGDLRWLRPFVPVVIQRVDPDTDLVVSTDYRGLVIGFDMDGSSLSIQIGGEAQGRASMVNRQVPLFPLVKDIGVLGYRAIRDIGLKFQPYLGPDTGVEVRSWGGQTMLEYVHQLVAMSWTRSGNRWSIMPTAKGVYEMAQKDRTTVHGTVYADDTRTIASLSRDLSEEPNRIFMTGVTPEGQRVRFGAYPGLKQTDPPPYPFTDERVFSEGTTNAETDTGDGISVMIGRLRVMGYLKGVDAAGGFDADVTRAINNLRDDAGLAINGNVNTAVWDALYDLDVTGYSLRWSRILPAAERSKVKRWRRSASGAVMGRNPNYDRTAPRVDRNVDAGTGFDRPQLREWAEAELAEATEDNWVGTIRFTTGALIAGDHTPGDPITSDDLMRTRDLRPGMNLSLPLFDGGTLVHVSAVTVSSDGTVSASVDTRARDALEVWEVIARNRESRRSPYREWVAQQRQSQQTKDTITIWDEVGGILGNDLHLKGNTWSVFPVVAGQEGTIARLRVRTNPNAEYVMAVFGKRIYPGRLRGMIGNPLTKAGTKRWSKESTQDALVDQYLMLYVAGSDVEPLGYYPKSKTKEGDTTGSAAPLTGRWQDDASFSYRTTGNAPVLWVAVWVDRDTTIPRGRMMWPQLEAGV